MPAFLRLDDYTHDGYNISEKTDESGSERHGKPSGKRLAEVRRILQAQHVIAFLVTVMIMKQWWFCVMMLGWERCSRCFGKVWCGMLCPNGGLADLVWSRVSLRLLPFPNWLGKGNVLRTLFVEA
jgi:hypothetical protein